MSPLFSPGDIVRAPLLPSGERQRGVVLGGSPPSYSVWLTTEARSFSSTDLEPTGETDLEALLGTHDEISYDLVMDDDMAFVEGTFRLRGCQWQVFIVSPCERGATAIEPQTWDSGVTGLLLRWPRSLRLGRRQVEQTLGRFLHVEHWTEVRGPDSIVLR